MDLSLHNRMKLRQVVRETVREALPKRLGGPQNINELSKEFADAKLYFQNIARSKVVTILNGATAKFKAAKGDVYRMQDVISSLNDAAEAIDNLETDF